MRTLVCCCLILIIQGCKNLPTEQRVQVGARPYYLIDNMTDGPLKQQLTECGNGPFYKTDFVIGHRGAPMQFPEHSKESYLAAARMGAGVLECDVAFTKDQQLVCRHSQCDLHTTTNILAIPELAAKCSQPFTPAKAGQPAQAKCCTSDISQTEFLRLKAKMDGANANAKTVAEYLQGTPNWRTDLYATSGTVMTHQQSIELFKSLGVKMAPELKSPEVSMPFNGFSQQDYAQKMLDEYLLLGVNSQDVYPQSFNLNDVKYWLTNNSEFANHSIYLDGRGEQPGFNAMDETTWQPSMQSLYDDGVRIIAPPMWMLLTLDESGKIVPSLYAIKAKQAGLNIITWSLERSGPLNSGGGYYYQSIANVIEQDGQVMNVIDVLAKQVGVMAIFSDWPATLSYYASCMGYPKSN